MARHMVKPTCGVLAVLVGFILLGGGGAAADADCRLRVGWEPYAIYTYAGEAGEVTGADIDLMRAIGRDLGCEITFKQAPWTRVLLEVEAGTIDVSTSTSRTPEREEYAWFSNSYRTTEMAIYVRRGEVDIYRLDDLGAVGRIGFKLGVIAGYHYGPEFAALMRDPAFAGFVDAAIDYQTNIRKLMHGRIDGYLVEDVGVMLAEAKTLGVLEQIERYPLAIPGEKLHLMFSRKSVDPETVAAVNASLERIMADGRLSKFLVRHMK